jgi:Siphovirus Gp157
MAAQPISFKVPRKSAATLRSIAKVDHAREAGVKRAIDRAHQVLSRLEARSAGFDAEIKKLQARKKHALARAAAIEERTLELMTEAGFEKLVGNTVTLVKRPNAAWLIIDDLSLIPQKYMHPDTPGGPNKVAIKVALEQFEAAEVRGEAIDAARILGVRLIQTVSLQRK